MIELARVDRLQFTAQVQPAVLREIVGQDVCYAWKVPVTMQGHGQLGSCLCQGRAGWPSAALRIVSGIRVLA